MRKKIIAAAVIVALVGGGGAYYYNSRTKATAAKQAVRYVPTTVKKGQIRSTISGTGPVASVNGVMVKSNQQGTVSQLLAQDGTKVKAGQVIMTLTNESLTGSLKQAQIDLANAQAALDALLNPQDTAVQAQRLKIQSARLTLQQRQQDVANLTVTAPISGVVTGVSTAEGSSVNANALLMTVYNDDAPTFVVMLPQQAAASVKVGQKASVDLPGFGRLEGTVIPSASTATPTNGSRDANVPVSISLPKTPGVRPGMAGQASMEVAGLTYLVQGNGSVKSDAVEVRAQVAGSVGQLAVKEGARVKAGDLLVKLVNDSLQVQLQQAENDIKTQEQSLTNLLDPSQDPNGSLRNARQKVDSAQITLQNRQNDVNDLQVKAPVDGQISSLTPRVGDRITANANLFRVADYGAMQVTITVDELDVAKAKVGQTAEITLDALPGKRYTGKVAKINPEGVFKNDIATFEVTVQIDKPDGLMAGMNAAVNVVVEDRQGLWLPPQAVRVQGGRAFVQILNKTTNQPEQKEVQVGLRTSQQVEITGGLTENEEVILTTVRQSTTTQLPGFLGGGQGGQGNAGGQAGGFQGGAGGFTGGQGGNRQNGGGAGR